MKKIRRMVGAKWLVMLVWLAGVAVVWEIFAFRVEEVKQTPENIMPHIWQIVQAIFSTNTVTRDQTALQVVLTSAGQTLERAALGFLIGTVLGICTGTADASVPRRGKNRSAVSDSHSGYSDSGHGTNCSGDHRRYRCFPNRHCGDPDILSGGCQYPFRISGNGAGEKRTDVFLCSQ